MKDSYKKSFIDINFYGMQSKVKNPMHDIKWAWKDNKTPNV